MRNLATSRTLVACGVAALAAIGSQAARAADITVSSAKIDAGRLKITGTTLTGGMDVRLDGQTATAFNTTSTTTAAKSFAFNIVYHPGDCIVAALCIKSTKRGEVI